jgi:hypothetical protein
VRHGISVAGVLMAGLRVVAMFHLLAMMVIGASGFVVAVNRHAGFSREKTQSKQR